MRYNFNCSKCGEIEINISHKELPLKQCPHCNSTNIERIWQATNSLWKCNGAYSKSNHKE